MGSLVPGRGSWLTTFLPGILTEEIIDSALWAHCVCV